MKIFRKRKSAVSSIEIMTIIILILAVGISFGGYIQRALAGRWKATGDVYGQGRQYDPRGFGNQGIDGGTLDCFLDPSTHVWIDENKFRKNNCDCTGIRGDGSPLPEYENDCIACKGLSLCEP